MTIHDTLFLTHTQVTPGTASTFYQHLVILDTNAKRACALHPVREKLVVTKNVGGFESEDEEMGDAASADMMACDG